MSAYLCITVRFADPTFHGRADGGEPEWPPSPLRVFQALVAACAARFGSPGRFRDYALPAFEWLSRLRPPIVYAPSRKVGTPFRSAVPNNDMDAIGRELVRGVVDATAPAKLKTLKPIRPTHLIAKDEFPAVHFLWHVDEGQQTECARHKEMLFAAARSVVALGWGIDMAFGNGRMLDRGQLATLEGEKWSPTPVGATTRLRVPSSGTFDGLVDRHSDFVSRLPEDGFKPVAPLAAFELVGYRRDSDFIPRPFVAFELRTPDFERFQMYDTQRQTPAVAGMVRNAVAEIAARMQPFGWSTEDINSFVHGHTRDGNDRAQGEGADRRFAFLPLPSIEQRPDGTHVTAIRRVLIAAPGECRDQVQWAKVLSGQPLSPIGDTRPAILKLIDLPESKAARDANLRHYVGESLIWSTVTPVVLHRHEPKPGEVEELLLAAFRHAGFTDELLNGIELDWRNVGFRAGVDLATRFRTPDSMTAPRFHVRVRFPHPVRGPLAIGAGRYRGMGLFAAE